MTRLFYSVRPREALRRQLVDLPLGFAHYSYGIVCQRFINVMTDLGVDPIELPMPEIYPSYRSFDADNAGGGRPIHLMFKAFDEFRILKGAYNIAHVAWEYTKLPSFERLPQFHPKRAHPLNDYVHALSLVDEIWVGCEFTREVLLREGLSNVHVIPAPIDAGPIATRRDTNRMRREAFMNTPLQIVECSRAGLTAAQVENPKPVPGEGLFIRIASRKNRGGMIFLSVFNPHDPRKNAGAMLAGFQVHCQRRGGTDLLVVKVLVDGKHHTLQDAIRTVVSQRLSEVCGAIDFIDSEEILLICGYMSDAELDRLYSLVDFYLCASNAEGQNLPILEAMARGTVPVSPDNTAMADYINQDTAVVLRSQPAPVHNIIAEAYGLPDAQWHDLSAADLALGVAKAVSLGSNRLDAMRRAATDLVRRRYSPARIGQMISERLRSIQNSLGVN